MQYDLLFSFDKETMAAAPNLGTEIPSEENGGLSADGLTWTIPIRDDVTWSDGTPLTAGDIAFTYNLVLDQNWSTFTSYLPFTDSITAPDDTTLVWKTTEPSIAPLIPPWIYILPEHIFGGMSKDEIKKFENFDKDGSAPVTSGPFRLVEWNKDEDWTLEANKDYFAGSPNLDRVIFKRYTNAETMVQDLKAGEIDFAESIPVELFRSLEADPNITDQRRRILLLLTDELQPVLRAERVQEQYRAPRARGRRGPQGDRDGDRQGEPRRTSVGWLRHARQHDRRAHDAVLALGSG